MGGGSFKYIIPSIIGLILIVLVLENKFILKDVLGNVYNITEAETNFDNIGIGDSTNFEINGYSDWQVIGKDDKEGTVDIVSKSSTESLTLDGNRDAEYYQNKFQETANKYTNNSYVISARTVQQSDLDNFSYEDEFWLDNMEDNIIQTSQGTWTAIEKNYKIYLIPCVEKAFENMESYSPGDRIEYSNNGVDKWIVSENEGTFLRLIPENPIELQVDNKYDASKVGYFAPTDETATQIIESFDNDVNNVGNYISRYDPTYTWSVTILNDLIPDFISQQTDRVILYSNNPRLGNGVIYYGYGGSTPYIENGELYTYLYPQVIYRYSFPKSLGYRPVITLKVSHTNDSKNVSDELQIGDYVNYGANGYENWRILSMDKSKDTIDIVSGGIVKNITLNGVNDYNNLESIIQTEVDKYKAGEKVESVRATNSDDILSLKKMNDKLSLEYWTSDKKVKKKNNAVNYAGSNTLTMNTLNVGIMYYDYEEDEIIKKWQPLSLTFTSDSEDAANYYRTNGYYINPTTYYEGDYSYTAGLRPIITLKLDSVEKLNDNEVQKIEESSKKIEKVLSREQDNKNNKSLSTKDKTTDTNTIIKSSKSDNNNDEKKTKRESIKTVYKNSPLIITGFVFSLICNFIEFVALLYFFLRMRKVK